MLHNNTGILFFAQQVLGNFQEEWLKEHGVSHWSVKTTTALYPNKEELRELFKGEAA
jgi:hypothetical protein